MKVLMGNSNRPLAEAIAAYLNLPLTKASVRRFSDMEVFVEIHENVRGEDVFVIQSTSYPANDHLMELLVCIDALRRASAKRITAVIPYFGYARQDRKPGPRTPISAKLVANLITTAGANRVLTMDLHAGQIQGFFDIPTDNLYAAPPLVDDIKEHFQGNNLMIVSPDVGGVVRARGYARRLGVDLAIVDKRREKAGESEVMNIIGDVEGRRHAVQRRSGLEEAGREISQRLRDPRRAFGRRCCSRRLLRARKPGDHRQHRGDRRGEDFEQYPPRLHRPTDWRGHAANQSGNVGFEPVRLTESRPLHNRHSRASGNLLGFKGVFGFPLERD